MIYNCNFQMRFLKAFNIWFNLIEAPCKFYRLSFLSLLPRHISLLISLLSNISHLFIGDHVILFSLFGCFTRYQVGVYVLCLISGCEVSRKINTINIRDRSTINKLCHVTNVYGRLVRYVCDKGCYIF